MINPPSPLTVGDAAKLVELEGRIQLAFAAIRDARLFREDFDSFEQYLAQRWIERSTDAGQ